MLVTLRIAISGYLLAFVLGLLIAMIRVSGNVYLSRLLLMFTEFIRLTPIPVQLFFFYYVYYVNTHYFNLFSNYKDIYIKILNLRTKAMLKLNI